MTLFPPNKPLCVLLGWLKKRRSHWSKRWNRHVIGPGWFMLIFYAPFGFLLFECKHFLLVDVCSQCLLDPSAAGDDPRPFQSVCRLIHVNNPPPTLLSFGAGFSSGAACEASEACSDHREAEKVRPQSICYHLDKLSMCIYVLVKNLKL